MEQPMTGVDMKIREVAGRIRELREIHGFSVEEMARRTDLSVEEYIACESGQRNLSKEVILARVWGYDSEAVENHVEVYVGFLRKKLQAIGSNVKIVSIRRMGYHLEVNEQC